MADMRVSSVAGGLLLLFLSFVAFLSVNYGLEVWPGSMRVQGAAFVALLSFAFACLLRPRRWRLVALAVGGVAVAAGVAIALL